jgi:hypothetical protein
VQVLVEVTGCLEKHQEALVAAAEKQEQPKATFMGDGKSLKSLGILNLTELLAQHAGELVAVLDKGFERQLWWMPWGEQVCAPCVLKKKRNVPNPVRHV